MSMQIAKNVINNLKLDMQASPMTVTLHLPFPVSVNAIYANGGR